jgi:hypothetical protein
MRCTALHDGYFQNNLPHERSRQAFISGLICEWLVFAEIEDHGGHT